MLMAGGETGYLTLLGHRLVPDVDRAEIQSWAGLLALLDALEAACPYGTLVFDALNGFERLCHEHVCDNEFRGDWGEKGFTAYQRGYDIAVADWLGLLARLDRLRGAAGCRVLLLGHSKVETFKNPGGADYDRWVCDVHRKTWAATHKWADAVLFGKFFTVVETQRAGGPEALKRGKGIGGTERIVYTQQRDAWDAKNRYGMPEAIDVPADASAIWNTLYGHIRPQEQ
jgi:hypothetical protein